MNDFRMRLPARWPKVIELAVLLWSEGTSLSRRLKEENRISGQRGHVAITVSTLDSRASGPANLGLSRRLELVPIRPVQGYTMKVPVAVLRLPRGPDGSSRGFDPLSPRFQALGPSSLPSGACKDPANREQEQQARVALRERYLRSLIAMAGQPVNFVMYEKVNVTALFRASDIDILNFQVSELQTPLGTQREALLRCSDIIAYSFEL